MIIPYQENIEIKDYFNFNGLKTKLHNITQFSFFLNMLLLTK